MKTHFLAEEQRSHRGKSLLLIAYTHYFCYSIFAAAFLLLYNLYQKAAAADEEGTDLMNIEISQKEYRDLLDIMHIADVIMTGHRRQEDPRSERHRQLVQRIYSLAGEAGAGELVAYDPERGKHVPTDAFEEGSLSHRFLDEFFDHMFWDELVSRLAVRDAAWKAGGVEKLNALSDDDRQALEGPIRERYVEEFSRDGIANLAIVDRFGAAGRDRAATSD